MKTSIPRQLICLLLPLAVLAGCASSVPAQKAQFTPYQQVQGARQIRVLKSTEIVLDTAYKRLIPENSTWKLSGTLPQGDVYRAEKTIFTIEGRQVHEAYLVLSGNSLVGFYLPGESNFSPLSPPLTLNFESVKHD